MGPFHGSLGFGGLRRQPSLVSRRKELGNRSALTVVYVSVRTGAIIPGGAGGVKPALRAYSAAGRGLANRAGHGRGETPGKAWKRGRGAARGLNPRAGPALLPGPGYFFGFFCNS